MSTLYTTLWLITNAYAAPLGYYESADACKDAANGISPPVAAQVLCVPSTVAMPLALNNSSQQVTQAAPPQGQAEAAAADISKVSLEGLPFVGDINAPVSMAYWYDYQCPFCKQLEDNVMQSLITDYVQQGKLKIIFKDVAFLGPDSETAGLAARAVWEVAPDKFFEWHKAMFGKQDQENGGWGSKADVLALTKTVPGIDAAKVEELMTSKAAEYQKAIEANSAEGGSIGVNGTPGVVLGKQLIVGAVPYAQFKTEIDAELAAK